ncbi:hypothetical protein [Rhodococcus sp. IEGM 1379]|uniref:hypothetical protein n=1 Tax=Rhodococcus sp. IEGM 1379 TaxID=3047086 RepID=UPI0024B6EB07|nr:hypothetical protein [Rhodococcus sp. IEGM 1379]MDI9916830.1 hypothetical protein [Rhodococcus sp. IEGM 1379]
MMPITKIVIWVLIVIAVGSASALVRGQKRLDSKDCILGLGAGVVAAFAWGVD